MTEEVKYPKCKGKNCGCTDGRSHSAECVAEHEAACNPDGIYSAPAQPEASPEPQAREWPHNRTALELVEQFQRPICDDVPREVYWRIIAHLRELESAAAQNAALRQEIERLRKDAESDERIIGNAHEYLLNLLQWVAPQLSPLPTLSGLCTQIDNYIAGLRQERDAAKELNSKSMCVYCGFVGEKGNSPEELRQNISKHVMECEHHPVRKFAFELAEAEQRAEAAEADLRQRDEQIARLQQK